MTISPSIRLVESPDHSLIEAIEVSRPRTPFSGAAYVMAMSSLGKKPIAILERLPDGKSHGCMGFLSGSPGFAKLTIPSLPCFNNPDNFWATVKDYARAKGIVDIDADSFAAVEPSMPAPEKGLVIMQRHEHVMSLTRPRLESGFSKNHRRSLKRATQHGLRLFQSSSDEAVDTHLALAARSLSRQAKKGTGIGITLNDAMLGALVRSGCATVWQAWKADECHSSVVILSNEQTAYYYSAGTTSDGLESRASVWLVASIAEKLIDSGLVEFNLGGSAADESGLYQFKSGFGCEQVPLCSARMRTVKGPRRVILKILAKLKRVIEN